MFNSITIGQYYPGNSFLHRLDPRTKIISVLSMMIALFAADEWGFLLMGVIIVAAIAVSGIPFSVIMKGLRPILVIAVFTFVLNVLMSPGEILWQWGWLTVTYDGLVRGAMLVYRLVLLVLFATLLTLTTPPVILTDGIEALLSPFKGIGVPAHELAMMMTIALRFIPTLLEEADKIMKAQIARGADLESGNIIQRVKNFIPILVPLFVSSFRRADDLAVAMEARCYRGGTGRTRLKELIYTGSDTFVYLLSLTVIAVIIWLSFYL